MEDNTKIEKIMIVTTGVVTTLVLGVFYIKLWAFSNAVVANLTAVLIK